MRLYEKTQRAERGARYLSALILALLLVGVTAPVAQATEGHQAHHRSRPTIDRERFSVPTFQECDGYSVSGELDARIKTKTYSNGKQVTYNRFDGVVTRSDNGHRFRLHHSCKETFDPSQGTLTLQGILFGIWDDDGSLIAQDRGRIVIDLETREILAMSCQFPAGPPPPPCWIYE